MQNPKVIDADGHIYENHEEIEEYFEGKYRGMRRARAYPLFPSLDGWPRGLGAGRPDKVTETRPEDVIKFVDNMGLESTALSVSFPPGLASGEKNQQRPPASRLCRSSFLPGRVDF